MPFVAEGPGRAARIAAISAANKSRVGRASLFHFFVRGVLAATVAEFFEFQPFRCRFAVLRCRIVPLFAITAL